jgi:hypothetical protein
MSETFPVVYLARHGETAWTVTGQHTGLTDLPLTERGEDNARRLGEVLKRLTFAKVFTSPLLRAMRTCELAGFKSVAEMDRDLVEWDYGEYEGLLTADILRTRPGWQLFRDGCPCGEIAAAGRCAGRSRSEPCAGRGGQCSGFFQRTFSASPRHTLDQNRNGQRTILNAKHSELERSELRKQPLAAGHPVLE